MWPPCLGAGSGGAGFVRLALDQGLYQGALDKLTHDILAKTDGCAVSGAPDRNDWLRSCEAQGQVYPLITEAIELINSLL